MGRHWSLSPQAFVVLAGLAALGLSYSTLFPRPAPAAKQQAAPAVAAASAPVAAVEPISRPVTAPAEPKAKPRPKGYLVVRPAPGRDLLVHARPRGRVVARLDGRTEFGSPQTVAVVRKTGRWLGVVTTHLANGRLGWVDRRAGGLRYDRTQLSLVLDLSARRLVLRHGKRVVRRMTVGVGRSGSPTPVGRFAVTDKLAGANYGAYYGCCILALSAHQPNLPPGWPGGDRIAIHGTNDPGSIGTASSAGCPHAHDADLRVLMRRVPLGTPVFIRS
jgi:lipoprotein-anchoring transpeptidase ErfK/SrfK